VGFEYGLAQGLFNKPVIMTQYKPKVKKTIKAEEKRVLEKIKKSGLIQYSVLPLDTASDLSAIYNIMYSDEKDLKENLRKAIDVKK